MADFVQVSLETIFYAVYLLSLPHILLVFNYFPVEPINYFVILIEDIFKMVNGILCSLSYYICFQAELEHLFYIFAITPGHCLTTQRIGTTFGALYISTLGTYYCT